MVIHTFMYFCARKYDILIITTALFVPSGLASPAGGYELLQRYWFLIGLSSVANHSH